MPLCFCLLNQTLVREFKALEPHITWTGMVKSWPAGVNGFSLSLSFFFYLDKKGVRYLHLRNKTELTSISHSNGCVQLWALNYLQFPEGTQLFFFAAGICLCVLTFQNTFLFHLLFWPTPVKSDDPSLEAILTFPQASPEHHSRLWFSIIAHTMLEVLAMSYLLYQTGCSSRVGPRTEPLRILWNQILPSQSPSLILGALGIISLSNLGPGP